MKDYAEPLEKVKQLSRKLNLLLADKNLKVSEPLAREMILAANDVYVYIITEGR